MYGGVREVREFLSIAGLILLLSGCGDAEVMTISPKLSCVYRVKCHLIKWRLGLSFGGPEIGGHHLDCTCDDGGIANRYATGR